LPSGGAGDEDFSYEKSSLPKNLRTKIFRARPFAHDAHKSGVAQDDVLPGDFDGVKAAAAHFGFKQVAPDLAIDGAHGSSDHAAALHGLGREDRIDPGDVFAKGRWGGALWKGGGVIGMLHGQRHLRSK
jgi:hypothetical protein